MSRDTKYIKIKAELEVDKTSEVYSEEFDEWSFLKPITQIQDKIKGNIYSITENVIEKETNENTFGIVENKVMQMLVRCLRYALTRNNHLEPAFTINEIKEYISKLTKYRDHWIDTFLQELSNNFIWNELDSNTEDNQKELQDFIEFLEERK